MRLRYEQMSRYFNGGFDVTSTSINIPDMFVSKQQNDAIMLIKSSNNFVIVSIVIWSSYNESK